MNINYKTNSIKNKALELGFDACGISRAEKLADQEQFLQKWLDKGLHAGMHYMSNHFEKRLDPTKLHEGTKSVISVLLNYYPDKQQNTGAPVVAKYAYGEDYHFVIKRKLNKLLSFINDNIENCSGRVFTDSAPVLDRAWAARAGLGWIGKNTNLISTTLGSFVFIGEILVDIELEYDKPITDRCGTCTKCIQSCPTNALVVPYLLDSYRCISYQTIENKGAISESLQGKFQNRVFGCDICQDVCPWNKNALPTKTEEFIPSESFLEMTEEDWKLLSEEDFKSIFKNSAVKRAKYGGIKRNVEFILKKQERGT